MTPRTLLAACLAALLTGIFILPACGAAPSLAGAWEGTLDAGGTTLALRFNLTGDDEGGYTATLDSITQGAHGIPCSDVLLEGSQLTIAVAAVGGEFVGTLNAEGTACTGTWTQSGQTFPLELRWQAEATPQPPRPQEPQPPFPYQSREVVVPHPDGHQLAGTLTYPDGTGPFPAVILLTGSGAQDRDETIFGHKPFLVLADHLTRHGLAVLRCDDRGVGGSTGDPHGDSYDFATDAAAMLAWLRQQPEADPARIGLCGHSEGALLAMIVASRQPDVVAFLISMAGTALSGTDLMPIQASELIRSAGGSQALADWSADIWRGFAVIVTAEQDDEAARAQVEALVRQSYESTTDAIRAEVGAVEPQVTAMRGMVGKWFRTFLTLDPMDYLRQVRCPVLALNGDRDRQVPSDPNMYIIGDTLEQAGNTQFEGIGISELNHLFQTCTTGHPSEYATIEETFAPKALNLITDWLARIGME